MDLTPWITPAAKYTMVNPLLGGSAHGKVSAITEHIKSQILQSRGHSKQRPMA
jgi:hypothetical protein